MWMDTAPHDAAACLPSVGPVGIGMPARTVGLLCKMALSRSFSTGRDCGTWLPGGGRGADWDGSSDALPGWAVSAKGLGASAASSAEAASAKGDLGGVPSGPEMVLGRPGSVGVSGLAGWMISARHSAG